LLLRPPPSSPLFPYTTLFRSRGSPMLFLLLTRDIRCAGFPFGHPTAHRILISQNTILSFQSPCSSHKSYFPFCSILSLMGVLPHLTETRFCCHPHCSHR